MFVQLIGQAPWTPAIARVCIALVFIVAGFGKLQGYDATVGYIGSLTNESVAAFLTVAAIIFELGGGLMLLFNYKTEHAIAMLIVFTVVAIFIGHTDFSDPAKSQMNMTQILKNLAIIGGLLLAARMVVREPEAVAAPQNHL